MYIRFLQSIMWVLCILFCNIQTFAQSDVSKQYVIVVDSGSTGSRLHIFRYQNNQTSGLPSIDDIFSEKTKPGIAKFANNLDGLENNLKPIFDKAIEKLNAEGVNPHTVPFFFYATAGMRLISEHDQQKIYERIRQILAEYPFDVKAAQTIPGKMEGLYSWLDVNYLANNFDKNSKTNGMIEMGGASTQITFAKQISNSQQCRENNSTICMKINKKNYRIFSTSYLGLGQDSAFNDMNASADAQVCYPAGYPLNGVPTNGFDFEKCSEIYQNVIQRIITKKIPNNSQDYFAVPAYFYIFNFFDSGNFPTKNTFQENISQKCSKNWDELTAECSASSTCVQNYLPFLNLYCANGVYVKNLIFDTYRFKEKQKINVVSQINGVSVDWTLGAALYYILKN